jgi:hypothetical protein
MAPSLLLLPLFLLPGPVPRTVEFNRDVRPILSDVCFTCHGPDKARRKGDLRLDLEEEGRKVVVPGHPEKSELYRRISSTDPSERMPPVRHPLRLTARQTETIRLWIAQGAKWQKHWAFLPPRRPPVPPVKNAGWVRNPIDAFVLERLEREGWTPAPEADRYTLLRRVSLDLTGLPPTAAEVDAFLADRRPDAYERVVDRLLASPRYGERMAIRWMNAARYADTNGYQSDGERVMWRWRDWVIDAYNHNLPFNRFTIEQLAGDLLPGATLDQKIATGFNRNHRGNGEGGIIPEEYQVEYVVDRVETTATLWLGLTIGCARCHEHKYDPVSQREFYQLFSYFNNVPEHGRANKYGNSAPVIPSPTRDQQRQLRELDEGLAVARQRWEDLANKVALAQAEWEKELRSAPLNGWYPGRKLQFELSTNGELGKAVHLRDGTPAWTDSPAGKALDLDGKRFLDAGNVGAFGFYDKFTLAAWVYPRGPSAGTIVSRMTDVEEGDGYTLRLVDGRLQLNLVKRWLDDALRVETERTLESDRWHHVAVSYDGSRVAAGVRFYLDGRPVPHKVLLDELNQSFDTREPLRIGAGGGPSSRFRGAIAGVRVYGDRLSVEEVLILATPGSIADLAAIPPAKRSPGVAARLRACFLEQGAPEATREAYRRLLERERERSRLIESFPTTMVMAERSPKRDTHLLIRGVYDRPGEKVEPGVPAVLPALPPAPGNDRSSLARWLVDPANPLTARVAVNRFWQMYFGAGLVKTVDDFGSQGEPPSHPELLDWLATEFVRLQWNMKAIQKLIVTSATYRQSSRAGRELLSRDPDNRLLARGARFRLPAEMLRDQALFAGGLLVERIGGPSVKPYQPAGIEKELGADPYVQDHGDKLYRRGLYVFWKRTVAPPMLLTFDSPGREACMVRETRTNTPLQALNLLNDVTFVEAARVLAERVLKEAKPAPEDRLTLAFRLVLARPPRPDEMKILQQALEHHHAVYRADEKATRKLLAVGEWPRDERLDPAEVAAYTNVVSVILNLDETLTKE